MINPASVLDLEMQENDAGAKTIRGYLIALLTELWREQEGFGGKRPFGNSGWSFELYKPLIANGLVDGAFDEDGYIETLDEKQADFLIASAILALGWVEQPEPPLFVAVTASSLDDDSEQDI